MYKQIVAFLLSIGCSNLHAQLFSLRPSLGFTKSIPKTIYTNAPSLGRIRPNIERSLTVGISVEYSIQPNGKLIVGYNLMECGYGWNIIPTNERQFTPVRHSSSNLFNQIYMGYSYGFNLLFESKTDKLEKKAGWSYDNGDNWLKLNLGLGPSLTTMGTPVENLTNPFLPGPSTNNSNRDFAWMLGYETPRYVHKTSIGIWLRTGLTFVKKGWDKLSLDFVMNIGLQDKYIIETNNKFGNIRTGQLIREEQFNVVSKGTSVALMVSYPIYFGKKK